MKRSKIDLIRVFTLLLLIASITYFYLFLFFPASIPNYLRFIPMPKNMNILVMGTDVVIDRVSHSVISDLGHTDTIIVVNINPLSSKINILSIPRDTLVEIPNYGWQKVNLAYFLGGPKLAKETIEKFLGITIQRYVAINPKGAINIIDLIGGMRIYVDTDMNYVDKWGGLHIDLKKGWQTLNGKQIHDLLRFRMGTTGDIGRVQRQQKFLRTLLRGLATPKMIAKSPWAIKIAMENIKTDLSLKEAIYLLNYSRFLSDKELNMSLLPGRFAIGEYNASIWYPDLDATGDIVNQYFIGKLGYKTKSKEMPSKSISIINNTGDFESVREIMHLLSKKNYAIINVTAESQADTTTTKVIAQKGDINTAKDIAKQIGVEEVEISGMGDIWSDFTIVVCGDWKDRYLSKINK